MPVRNGAALLGRAIRSLLRQTCPDWELIAVDDCSSDGSAEMLKAWADRDPRIRLVRLPENVGPGAARNAALRVAQGRMIAYLDHDDEYFPDYLEAVMRHRGKGDVLVFGYDVVHDDRASPHLNPLPRGEGTGGRKSEIRSSKYETNSKIQNLKSETERPHPNPLPVGEGTKSPNLLPRGEGTGGPNAGPVREGEGTERVETWDPTPLRHNLFAVSPAVPLGIAHCRSLLEKVGGFNELLWHEEDWDFWKRLARAGAEFSFLPLKSGRYHVRADSLSRVPHLSPRQRQTVVANWEAGRPIFTPAENEKYEISDLRREESPHPNPLPEGEGTNSPHPNPLPKGEGTDGPHPGPLPVGEGTRKIVFLSPHCLADPTSGAAVATAQGLRFLQTLGFQCRAFCGARLDRPEEIETALRRHGIVYRHSALDVGNGQAPVLVAALEGFRGHGADGPLEVTIFPQEAARQTDFYRACGAFLDADRPDAALTYGGDPLAETLIRLAKNRDLPVVFWLHNFAYHDPRAFRLADYVIVPSQFNRRYYWESMGLAAQVLPLVVDWTRAEVEICPNPNRLPVGGGTAGRKSEIRNSKSETNSEIQNLKSETRNPHPNPLPVGEGTNSPHPNPLTEGEGTNSPHPLPVGDGTNSPHPNPLPKGEGTNSPRPLPAGEGTACYVTFVNPEPIKGLYVFARIAAQLACRRPDIPLLVMSGRSRAGWQQQTGIDLSQLPNVTIRSSAPDPREFYAATRLLLMPSLWNESFGLVAAEAMLNGIPVLASNRGALPETIGHAGFLFDIPARYTSGTRDVPTPEEVEPWVETIIRLWDHAAEYDSRSHAAREHAVQWHPSRLAPIYREFFGRITHQPGPPLVPIQPAREI
jgi:glycosyltransferase involved in cell wall biosynthesis/GT2 family glycosyltransferase